MVLSEKELVDVNALAKKANLSQLVALSGLFQAYVEAGIKDEQESLALLISREERK